MSWILTAGGRRFDLVNPTPDMVDLGDIAHALSQICRFTGHTRELYSVAQHSVLVARHAPPGLELAALLHDAAEAYIGDVSAPLKAMLPDYRAVEARVWAAIAARFGLQRGPDGRIHALDMQALVTERRDLMPWDGLPWAGVAAKPWPEVICAWPPALARDSFESAFKRYTHGA